MLISSSLSRRDHAAEGGAAFDDHAASPKIADVEEPLKAADVEEPLKAAAQMSAQELVEELTGIAARQAELVTQLKARTVVEGGSLAQRDEQIAQLKAQLAEAQAEVLAADERAKKATEEKLVVMAELQRERGEAQQYKADLAWG